MPISRWFTPNLFHGRRADSSICSSPTNRVEAVVPCFRRRSSLCGKDNEEERDSFGGERHEWLKA